MVLFHSELPKGKGNELAYSPLNAFALSICVHLIDAGFPQLKSYETVGALWPRLTRAYSRISAVVTAEGGHTHTDNTLGTLPSVPSLRNPDIDQPDRRIFLLIPQMAKPNADGVPIGEAEIVDGLVKLSARLQKLMPDDINGTYLLELSGLITRFDELSRLTSPKRRGPGN